MAKEQKTKEPEKMVSIPESELAEIRTALGELRKDRDMLLQVADKKQMSIYYQRNKGKMPGRVKLRTMNEKVILGWRTTQDEVYQEAGTMRWTEKQRVELLYEDGTAEEFWLMDYVRKYKQVEAEVVSRIVDETTGNVALKVVRLDNGKEYTIGISFVN